MLCHGTGCQPVCPGLAHAACLHKYQFHLRCAITLCAVSMIGMSDMQHLQCPYALSVAESYHSLKCCSVLLSATCCSLLQLTAANHELFADAAAEAQGYLKIRLVCTDDVWQVVQSLYDFTQAAMVRPATGRVVVLVSWTNADSSVRYRKLVQTTRPMVHRSMGTADWSRARFNGQPLHATAPRPAVRRSEGKALSSTVCSFVLSC